MDLQWHLIRANVGISGRNGNATVSWNCLTWEDKGLFADGFIQTYDTVFPKYVLYPMNFRDYNKPWITGADMTFQFPEGVVPEVGTNTMTVHIDAPEGVAFTKTYNVTATDSMLPLRLPKR